MTDFWVEKKTFGGKNAIYQKKIRLGFSWKMEVPSLARLGLETIQLGLTQLGKFQLKIITSK